MWGRGVGLVEITDSVFQIFEIRLGFPHAIQVVITLPINKIFKFFFLFRQESTI